MGLLRNLKSWWLPVAVSKAAPTSSAQLPTARKDKFMKFSSPEALECMFRYIGSHDVDFDKWCSFLEFSNMTMAEYISLYCFEDFRTYCSKELNIEIERG